MRKKASVAMEELFKVPRGTFSASTMCDKCKKRDKVKTGPGAYGTDCWCSRCKIGWEQAA